MDELEGLVDKSGQPSDIDLIYYIFWERGIDYNAMKSLPIPYIIAMLKTHNWIKQEEIKAQKKAAAQRH